MNVAVLGYGSQGVSAFEYWREQGHTVTVCDQNEALIAPEGIATQLGADYLHELGRFDLLVRSPSIHPHDILAANSIEILEKVTTNTNEFMKICPSRNIIGVTGTKGKGTTSTLITHILEEAGYRVHLGGNIGIAPLEMLKNNIRPSDYVVLELANFQLIDIKYSPPLAVCLMVEAEHLNWHPDLAEYMMAKQQLFRWQKPEDTAVFYAKNERSKQIVSISPGHQVPYYDKPGAEVVEGRVMIGSTEICAVDEIQLLGEHNWQNICAAVTAVWQITQDVTAVRRAIRTFTGLPFRLELIRELNGVKYYNDSFGTTPETAIVAIKAFQQPKVVILGGSDKGSNYKELAQTVASTNVKHVVAIGLMAETILGELDKADGGRAIERTKLEGKPTMAEIVANAHSHAEPGDIVLLSTGCASFGLFDNYKDRGEQFNQAVQSLV